MDTPEPPWVGRWREEYRRRLAEQGPTPSEVLTAILLERHPGLVTPGAAEALLRVDPILVIANGMVALGLDRRLRLQAERDITDILTGYPAAMTCGEVISAWRDRDPTIGRWVPASDLEAVIAAGVRRRAFIEYPDGTVGLRRPDRLPDVLPWQDSGRPFSTTTAVQDEEMTLDADEPGTVASLVANVVGDTAFRSLRLTSPLDDGSDAVVGVAVVELPGVIVLITAFQLDRREGLAALGAMPWWFWPVTVANPLRIPYERLVSPTFDVQPPVLAVHATWVCPESG